MIHILFYCKCYMLYTMLPTEKIYWNVCCKYLILVKLVIEYQQSCK